MDFRILGPLEVRNDLGAIDVPGRKPRAVLAVLLLHANQPVSAERLAVALWGREAPAGAIRTVHVNVSRLRKALGGGDGEILTTTPAGYLLRVQPGELDADRFERLVDDGRRALVGGQVDDAGRLLREALALWRGPPLGDLAFEPFAQAEIARLEEQHEAAIAARVEADLAAGRHVELVGELRRLVAEHPTHERLAGQLMLALYRCGRQADALDAYREARRRLADELGVEPGDELRALQDAILHQDPKLVIEQASELPHELDAAGAPPLVGRETELAWLRERWDEARAGDGRLIALAGADGMGKSRLAAELATEVHAGGGSVLYASGAGPARAVHDVLKCGRAARRPLLLVVDEADQASREVLTAVRDIAGGEVLVIATATAHEALEGLEPGIVLFLDLDRLGPAAVAKIAALYVPDEASDVLPAEWLLGASAGVPQRVHDVASQWARERVGAVAGHAAAGRSRLRSMEDELAGGVVQLQAVREWREPPENGEQRVICPFKGLASFEAADAPYFFGRERLVAELVARLVGAPLLGVVGPSGSGKSSVVRAGLLPALENGVLPGSERWPQCVIRPGEHPLRQLKEATTGRSDRFVLAVDQFEETFTVCRDESERADFISELVRQPDAVVVIALRADFYGRCAEYPALSRLLASNHVLVGPMQPEELRRAITCPAQRVGLSVEDELVQKIVDDVEDAPGALPLVSTALLELWQHRDGRRLRLASYERTGGVRGAVARLAEEAYTHLDEPQRELARRVLLQLVEVDEDGAVERRRIQLTDVGAEAEPLLDVLADRRLVTVSEGNVEVAHEALLREWPRLQGWIEDGLEDLRIERGLRAGAREWERVGRDDGALYRGARLAEARDRSLRAGPLPDAENDFLEASLQRANRDRRTRRRGLAIVFGGLVLGLAAVAVVAAVAIDQRSDAIEERNTTASRQLALESASVLDPDPELALRLAISAFDSAPTDQAATALREATGAFRQVGAVRADSTDAWTAAYSPDGARVVTGGTDGRAIVWDAARREANELAGGHGALHAARYAPDGQAIALGFEDGRVLLTDQALGKTRTVLEAGAAVRSVAFSGDGERLAVAVDDGTVRLVTLDDSEPPRRHDEHEGTVHAVDFSADGTRVVSGGADGSVVLWRLADDSHLTLDGGDLVRDVAFSPDGDLLLAVSEDGEIRRWDGNTGRAEGRIAGSGGALYAVAFSGDGSRFAAGGIEGVIGVWSTAGESPLAVLRGQRSRVYDLGFERERDRVVSAGDDGVVRIWDARGTVAAAVPGDGRFIDFNPDGNLIASSSEDGGVHLWDAGTGRRVDTLQGTKGFTVAEFSSESDAVVIADAGSRARVWEGDGAAASTVLQLQDGKTVDAVGFDHAEQRIVYVESLDTVVVYDLESRTGMPLQGDSHVVYDAQFSPDDERVGSITEDGDVLIWRLGEPARPEILKGHTGHQNGLDFAPDGRLATAGGDGTVRVWPAGDGAAVVMRGHTSEVTGVAFWPDGSKVLSTSMDGTLRLWNSRTGGPMGRLEIGADQLHDIAVSRDGRIATLDENDVLRIFSCDVCGSLDDVAALARSRHPRQLDAEERERFLVAAG